MPLGFPAPWPALSCWAAPEVTQLLRFQLVGRGAGGHLSSRGLPLAPNGPGTVSQLRTLSLWPHHLCCSESLLSGLQGVPYEEVPLRATMGTGGGGANIYQELAPTLSS